MTQSTAETTARNLIKKEIARNEAMVEDQTEALMGMYEEIAARLTVLSEREGVLNVLRRSLKNL